MVLSLLASGGPNDAPPFFILLTVVFMGIIAIALILAHFRQSLLILKIVNDRSQINSCFRSDRPHGHAIKSPEGKKLLCSTEDFAAGFRRTVGLGFAGRRHLLNNQTMRRLAGRTA